MSKIKMNVVDQEATISWEDMVRKYPNKWIAVRNPVMDGPDIVSGVVHAVLSDDEIIDYEDEHQDEGLVYRRTKGGWTNGPIRANFIIETS